jgi:hypothetical protein
MHICWKQPTAKPCYVCVHILTVSVILQIYALFKQGSGETKFEDAPKPGMFDLKVSERATASNDSEHRQRAPTASISITAIAATEASMVI